MTFFKGRRTKDEVLKKTNNVNFIGHSGNWWFPFISGI